MDKSTPTELYELILTHRDLILSTEVWSPDEQAMVSRPLFRFDDSEPVLRNKRIVPSGCGLKPTIDSMLSIGWTDRRQELVEACLGKDLLESDRFRKTIAEYGPHWRSVVSSWPKNLGIKSLTPVAFLEPYEPGITLRLHELAKTKEFSSMRIADDTFQASIVIERNEDGDFVVVDKRMPSIWDRGYPVYEGDELLERFDRPIQPSYRALLMAERAMCEYVGRLELTENFVEQTCVLCATKFWPQGLDRFTVEKTGVPRYCPDCCSLRSDAWRKMPLDIEAVKEKALRGIELVAELTGLFPFRSLKRQPIAHLEPEERDRWFMAQVFMPGDSVKMLFGGWEEMLALTDQLGARPRKGRGGYVSTSSCGHTCLSIGERTVCDRLAELGIEHQKEPVYPEHPELNPSGRLRGDWLVGDTWVEFAGYLDDSTYSRKMAQKQELARVLGLKHLVLIPADLRRLDDALGGLTDN